MSTGPPVEAEGLVRRFGDIVAVDGVSLAVEAGEVFGFLGPNGAGKSTCVRMLVTLLAPAGGARFEAGPLGVVTLLVAAGGTATVHALWTLGIAYRARSQRAAPLMQIGVFLTIFLATAQVPLSVMGGWLRTVARVNPMTNVLRLARADFVGGDGVTWAECWGGLLALGVAIALAALWAVRGMRKLVR